MPVNITPVDDWDSTDVVQAPGVGDAGSAAFIQTQFQTIENRLERIAMRIPGLVDNRGTAQRLECCVPYKKEGTFVTSFGGFYQESVDAITTHSNQKTWFHIPVFTGQSGGGRVTYVRATVKASGCTVLPTTMPTIKVYSVDLTTGTAAQIGSTATDGSATTGAFNTLHTIDTATLNFTATTDKRFMVEFGWGNAGTVTDFKMISLAAYVDGGA